MLISLFLASFHAASVRQYCLSLFGCPTCSLYGCESCPSGFFLSSINYLQPVNLCVKCSFGCDSCSNYTVCEQCNSNFNRSAEGMCSCNNCQSSQNMKCQPGTYSDFTMYTCLPCPLFLNCYTCSNATFCSECSQGSFLGAVSQMGQSYLQSCTRCPTNCLECNAEGCLECYQTYELVQGKCQCQQEQQCSACISTTFYNGQSCQPCLPELHCPLCSAQLICSSCNVGYYMTLVTFEGLVLQSCLLCPPTCSACQSSTRCTSCLDGSDNCYNNPCYSATTNCSNCILEKNNVTLCTGCSDGFYLSSNKCQACPVHCQTCPNSLICSGCLAGYYLSINTCYPCDPGCLTCLPNQLCIGCVDGYYASGTGVCLGCGPGCLKCQSASVCMVCANGLINENGRCQQKQSGEGAIIGLSIFLSIEIILTLFLGYMIYNKK